LHTKTNAALEQRVSDLLRQLDDCQLADERGAQRELDEKAELLEELEAEKQLLLEEKEELAVRNSELMESLKRAKENNLTANRELIKLNSELTFTRNEQANAEAKLAKAKEELSSLRGRLESAV
jgi:chromosome segregation ATPase